MLGAIRKPLAMVANAILDNQPAENLQYSLHLASLRKRASKSINDSLPLVTVVVPIYNVEAYLEVCLLSLAAQTHRNVAVVMVDDGSKDGSAKIAKRFAADYPNFTLVSKSNNGLGAARNTGVQAIAKSDWLLFVDSDDVLPVGAIENYLRIAIADKVQLVVGNPIRLMGFKRQSRRPELYKKDLHKTTLHDHPEFMSDVTAWNKLISFEFWVGNGFRFPENVLYEDMAVMTQLYLQAGKFSSASAPSYLWRVRTGDTKSITQKRAETRNLNDRIKAILNTVEVLKGDSKLLYEYGRIVATHDLGYYIPSIKETDQAYFEALSEAANRVFKETGFNDFSSLQEKPRTLISLLLAGDRAGLISKL
jgi:CDP-glycerol glycerophosphotransferase